MTTKTTTHTRYIAQTSDGLYGHFGYGDSMIESLQNLKKSSGEIRKNRKTGEYKPKKGYSLKVYRFLSELPFAPHNREAAEQEAYAWIGQDGSCNWIRCERELIHKEINK